MPKEFELENIVLRSSGPLPPKASLGQHVFQDLRKMIIRGEIPAGGRLVESAVAAAFGISRTPVREALHKLEREGLATPTIQGGYTVASLTRKEIEDIFGIRSILESYAGRIATISYQDGDLRELEEKHGEAQRKLRNNQLEDLARINTEFHDILYSLSRRPKLIEMINNLQDQTYRFRRMILRVAKNAQVSISTHGILLVALRKRDADRVETLIRKHILRGQRIILKSLEKKEEKF